MKYCLSLPNKVAGGDVEIQSEITSRYCNNGSCSYEEVRNELLYIMHKIGMIGLKATPTSTYIWSEHDHPLIAKSEINSDTKIAIHPMFYKALNIQSASQHR